jgi:NAD(P)-dependent dehydrogenase (short-subunit alcohol dehydrogenase family)
MMLDSSVAAVIVGGASGLGAATARALHVKGVKVALIDLNPQLGEVVAADIGGIFCQADVTDEAQIDAAFVKARAAHGQERILVNCAGIGKSLKTVSRSREDGSISRFPLDAFNQVLQVNLVGTFRCITRSVAGMLELQPLRDGDRGVIVNTASVAAEDGQVGQAAYAASKGGVVSMTLPIARDLASENIRVNTILPGLFHTPMLARLSKSALDSLSASVPFPRRLGDPAEYAQLALTMIECGYLNGVSIRLDGAIRMAPR